MNKPILKIFLFILIIIICQNNNTQAHNIGDTSGFHELTIYIIDAASPISWESPAALYRTVKKSFIKSVFQRHSHTLGHMIFSLKSDLLKEPVWMGMTLRYNLDMFTQFYLRKAGLSILIRPFRGRLEGRKRVENDIKFNVNKKKVAFITYSINENSVKEILKFLTEFQKKTNGKEAPCDFYCPVYWPLFDGEGSSCSSLCMAVLEAAGIYMEGREQWIEKMKIPLELIGGDINYGKKISLRKIKRWKNWYNGKGKSDTDYVKFEVYDPILMKKWITQTAERQSANGGKGNNPPGLTVDYTEVQPLDLKSIMKKRPETSLFIKPFYEKL